MESVVLSHHRRCSSCGPTLQSQVPAPRRPLHQAPAAATVKDGRRREAPRSASRSTAKAPPATSSSTTSTRSAPSSSTPRINFTTPRRGSTTGEALRRRPQLFSLPLAGAATVVILGVAAA